MACSTSNEDKVIVSADNKIDISEGIGTDLLICELNTILLQGFSKNFQSRKEDLFARQGGHYGLKGLVVLTEFDLYFYHIIYFGGFCIVEQHEVNALLFVRL